MSSNVKNNKLEMVKSMHNIIMHLNNEMAYMSWINLMPDEASEDDFEWFVLSENENDFEQLTQLFANLMSQYLSDGIFVENKLYISGE